jgi:hypothetical protein
MMLTLRFPCVTTPCEWRLFETATEAQKKAILFGLSSIPKSDGVVFWDQPEGVRVRFPSQEYAVAFEYCWVAHLTTSLAGPRPVRSRDEQKR